jgi:transcriptional regulator with XRE-family HTH domain
MLANDLKNKGSDHEVVILLHLVQMVKVVRKIPDEALAERLGVSAEEVAQVFSESSRPSLEQLRELFLAVGMDADGVFETFPEHPGKTFLAPEGFGNAIERGLLILNETGPDEEGGEGATAGEGAVRESSAKRSRTRREKGG